MNEFKLQVGKLVGASDHRAWAQTHVFLPEDTKKRQEYGNLLAAFCLQAKQEDLDLASFGKEIISRFQEIYFSSTKEGILHRLKDSLQVLINEFQAQVAVESAVAICINTEAGNIGYFATAGKSQIYLSRDNSVVLVLAGEEENIRSASGFIEFGDVVILGTSQLYEIISSGSLKAALENKDALIVSETLAPIIHGHPSNNLTAAVVFKIEEIIEPSLIPTEFPQDKQISIDKPKFNISNTYNNIKNNSSTFFSKFKQSVIEKSLYIRDEQQEKRAKKTTLTVAIILAVLLLVSVFFSTRQKRTTVETKAVDSIIQEVSYKFEQAVPLEELNPLRARAMLTEAKDLINQESGKLKNKNDKTKLDQLLSKIEQELEKVAREYKFDKLDIFLDLTLAQESFKGNIWGITENNMYVYDQEKSSVLEVMADTKSFKVVAGGDRLIGGQLISATTGRIFVITRDKIITTDAEKSTVIAETKADDWGNIADARGFSGNVYLLDKTKEQIWKYRSTGEGLGSKGTYLKTKASELSEGISMAIDGSVWVLLSDGTINKYTRGEPDNFVVSGLDKAIGEEAKLFTNETLDNLYILDKKNLRVLVISKATGEYQAQYVWSGIAGARDLAAFEDQGKILLLTGERIYQIEIKK